MRRVLLVLAIYVMFAFRASAETADSQQRAHHLAEQIRCMVCQGQSIDESDADLAKDLNKLIREKLQMGWSDQEILDFLKARYGDFILLKPPFTSYTFILWLGPLFLLGGGIMVILPYWRQR